MPKMLRWLGIPWLLRRWAFQSGVRSNNDLVRFVAMVAIGRAAYLRRTARVRGVYGREPAWVALSGAFLVKDIVAKLTVKEVDVLTTERLRAGERVTITSIPPDTRRGRRSTSA